MKNTKEHIKLAQLLAKELSGDLSEKEKKQLTFFEQDEEKREIILSVREKAIDSERLKRYKTFNVEEARKKVGWKIRFRKQTKPQKTFNLLRYAALIALPIALAGYLVYIFTVTQPDMLSQVSRDIKPGEKNAMLYFSNGDVINLKEDTSSFICSKDNLLVKKDSIQLRFNSDLLHASKLNNMNRIVTPIGGEYQVELPDGTKVWLNADSYLEFPSKFSNKQRKVIAKGELYFDVAKNKDWPFIVESNGMKLKVLGTEFNLRAYSDEREMVSTLVEGSVLVSNSFGNQVILRPGRQVFVSTSSKSMQEGQANVEAVVAWKNGRFIFDNRRIEDIMYDLSRWYDVKVFFANSKVKDKRFSVDVPRYGEIESILTLIEGTGEIYFTITNNVITVK